MDVSRAVLDNLMGRDRNKPMDLITQRDHYSNPDVLLIIRKVCKSFLICFCFNTLFPNTTYDEGPCEKRHDTYLKTMFDSDPSRAQYEREYIRECIHWIERRLQQVQKKTKQNQSVIDNKSNFPADRPKQVLDRILAIEEDIEKLIEESQRFGQEGKIDESARCLEEVERLRDRRREIELMGTDSTTAQKQQKICQICGAIQTINDTEKRIQTHLQGKIHQGFLKLRHEVETLKIRLQVLNKMNPPEKREKEQQQRAEKRRQEREKQRERQREKERQRERQKQNERKRQQPEKRVEKVQNGKEKVKEERERSDSASRRRRRERSRERRRDSRERRSRSKERREKKHHRDSREKDRKDKDHKKKHKKNRSRSKEKQDY